MEVFSLESFMTYSSKIRLIYFFHTLKDSSKIQLYYITNDDIQKVEQAVLQDIILLRGTMQVHQVFSDTPGLLQYRDLSCFCQRGFCACFSPQTYQPIPVSTSPISPPKGSNDLEIPYDVIPERDGLETINEIEVLTNISNIVGNPKKSYYETVYSPISSSDDELLSQLKIQQEVSISNTYERNLIEKENVHPSKISSGVYIVVKVSSDKDNLYFYLGVAQSNVDDEGEIKVMFLKAVDDSGKMFKLVERDVSYEPYENIVEIVPKP